MDFVVAIKQYADAAIGTLIVATSVIQLANGFFSTLISLRVALEGFDATMAGLCSAATSPALRSARCAATGSSPDRPHPRLCRLRRPGRRRDRRHAAPGRGAPLAGAACAGRLRLRRVVRHDRELAQRQVAARRAGPGLCGLHGRHLHGPRRRAIADRPDRRRGGRPFNAIVALFALALVLVSTTRAEPPQAAPSRRRPMGSSRARRRSLSCAAR